MDSKYLNDKITSALELQQFFNYIIHKKAKQQTITSSISRNTVSFFKLMAITVAGPFNVGAT